MCIRDRTKALGDRIQLVGDDLFVTNVERVKKGLELHVANAVPVSYTHLDVYKRQGARLHLVKPLGFDISDSAVKRAGLKKLG